MLNRDHIVLAALDNGEHVQIGKACHHDDAHAHHEYLDGQISGYYRDSQGAMRLGPPTRKHFIDGHAVKFYRVRQVPNEFGDVRRFPLSALRYTSGRKEAKPVNPRKTPGGIARPKSGKYSTYRKAATVAKGKNVEHGRGYRALKAQDGSYGVIFRPAVASNKQRRNREVV